MRRLVVNACQTHRKARELLAGKPRVMQTHNALVFFSDSQKKNACLARGLPVGACHRSLSLGIIGIPRHVMKPPEPSKGIVGGGTPRLVASRPKAAIALGWARKNAGFFQTRAISLVQIVRCRGPASCRNALSLGDIGQKTKVFVVYKLVLLFFLDGLYGSDAAAREAGRSESRRDR